MLNKKGELTTKEILEIILAVAVVLGMAVLLYKLISPSFNVDEETAKSYLSSFMDEIGVADSGDVGNFLIWQVESGKEFYLVYFGDGSSVMMEREDMLIIPGADETPIITEVVFSSLNNDMNRVCICYWESSEKTGCLSCEELRGPAFMDGNDRWVVEPGDKIKVELKEGVYEITKI